MWRRFSSRRGHGPVGGYSRGGLGMSYAATVLIVALAAILLLYFMGYL